MSALTTLASRTLEHPPQRLAEGNTPASSVVYNACLAAFCSASCAYLLLIVDQKAFTLEHQSQRFGWHRAGDQADARGREPQDVLAPHQNNQVDAEKPC